MINRDSIFSALAIDAKSYFRNLDFFNAEHVAYVLDFDPLTRTLEKEAAVSDLRIGSVRVISV